MASDNRASYTVVGFTVLIGLAAIAAVLVRFGGVGGHRHEYLVETYYDKPVGGLSVGSPVNFRGVKVGEVRDIDFASCVYDTTDRMDMMRVVIVMALDMKRLGMDAPEERARAEERLARAISNGFRATVTVNGITGLAKVDLGTVAEPLPPAKLAWTPRHPLIPPQPSLMDDLGAAARKALSQFNRMDILSVWSNVSATAASASRVANQVDVFVDSQREGLASIVRNVDDATASVRDLAESLKENPSRILHDNTPEPLDETQR